MACKAAVLACVLSLAACGTTPTEPGPPAPQVSSVTPSRGPISGGTRVRIVGSGFAAGAVVSIGGVAAVDVVVESAAGIMATTAAHAPGASDVSVTVSGRSGVLASAFTFDAPVGEPPVVTGVTARGGRNDPADFANLGDEITVVATAQDPDTASDQLTFAWSADAGTFSGSGASVRWRAPATGSTPTQVRLTVTVSDPASNRGTGSTTVRLHDSTKEVGDLARDFLLDFSDSTKSPAVVMRNFSTGARCASERAAELSQVTDNRTNYRIDKSSIGPATVNFEFAGVPCSYPPNHRVNGDACAAVPAVWDSLCLVTNAECTRGQATHVSGVDFVTAVYEQSQWRLCASYYKPAGAAHPLFIR